MEKYHHAALRYMKFISILMNRRPSRLRMMRLSTGSRRATKGEKRKTKWATQYIGYRRTNRAQYHAPHAICPLSARRVVDCMSVHPLKMMNTPTAWKPRPDILSQANLRIVIASAAMLLQSAGGSTPCSK